MVSASHYRKRVTSFSDDAERREQCTRRLRTSRTCGNLDHPQYRIRLYLVGLISLEVTAIRCDAVITAHDFQRRHIVSEFHGPTTQRTERLASCHVRAAETLPTHFHAVLDSGQTIIHPDFHRHTTHSDTALRAAARANRVLSLQLSFTWSAALSQSSDALG